MSKDVLLCREVLRDGVLRLPVLHRTEEMHSVWTESLIHCRSLVDSDHIFRKRHLAPFLGTRVRGTEVLLPGAVSLRGPEEERWMSEEGPLKVSSLTRTHRIWDGEKRETQDGRMYLREGWESVPYSNHPEEQPLRTSKPHNSNKVLL